MNLIPNFLVYDNFYNNVDAVREYALSLPFTVTGNFPGARTTAMSGANFDNCRSMIEQLMYRKINFWPSEYNTSFQFTTQDATTWIHHDETMWAGVLYLTPDAPADSGTAIYRNNETGIFCWDTANASTDYNNDSALISDYTRWTPTIQAANVYNRLIIYRGELYHSSVLAGFGNNQFDGRLSQTFFFNTEL
jgi:hypothetical protein